MICASNFDRLHPIVSATIYQKSQIMFTLSKIHGFLLYAVVWRNIRVVVSFVPTTVFAQSNACNRPPQWQATTPEFSASLKDPTQALFRSAISYNIDELGGILGGKGRARACFDCYRMGVDPVWLYTDDDGGGNTENVGILEGPGWSRKRIQDEMSGRITNGLGWQTLTFLSEHFGSIEHNVALLSKYTTCTDGTTKLLLELLHDGLEVETVIIPWNDRGKSTLCISSQVGCRQACTFCATGRMGKLRSLTSDEILAQLYWAHKTCRLQGIYPIENVVFMGLGEPADNVEPVVRAARNLVDPNLFALSPRRVTISTVAPTPESFEELGRAETVLAWSVHAAKDELRKILVPTTQYSMATLRAGLIQTLQKRRKALRNTMLEITLLDEINDAEEDALHLAEFCRPMLEEVKNIKLVVNLIPWNDIAATSGPAAEYRKPSSERVLAFQKVLIDHGIVCYVRKTRGDEEKAACGMLSTKKRRPSD